MNKSTVFQGAYPIGDTNVHQLPIKDIGPAVAYYTQVLGFRLVEKDSESATLERDDAKIGLARNGTDPEQTSCYFSVSDVEALRQELDDKGVEPSPISVNEHDGKKYRVFFAKEPYGVCFCFGQPA